ncbi:PIN-like domain-containing protein [Aeromonas enteropelogenes]|uniref:PIN-like domain-containing protein n=1 Tax=Aeromonas enteropelogenes TaxID=29489 RepID=UPI003F7474C7
MQLGHYTFDTTIDEYQSKIAEIVSNKRTLIFFDTNILAYLYKLHANARHEFYAWSDSVIKDNRLFIPGWAASEYSNRVTTNKLDDYTNKSNNASPDKAKKMYEALYEIASLFVDADILARSNFKGNREQFLDEFRQNIKSLDTFTRVFNTQFEVGDVHNEITKHFSTVVLNSNLTKLCVKANREGDTRFEHRLPPGFKDGSKGENRFGDLIIWYEILIKSKELKDDFDHVVFLSNDEKSDWVYAPKSRANTNSGTRKFVSNKNPVIKIADPRLVTEFSNSLGHSNFTVCSLALLIESLSKTEPQHFTNLAGAIQINIQETSTPEKEAAEPAEVVAESSEVVAPPAEIVPPPAEVVPPPAEVVPPPAEVVPPPAEVVPPPAEVVAPPAEVVPPPAEVVAPPAEEETLIFEYNQEALQDSLYQTDASSEINEIICDLKSYNWYTQNPAISKIGLLAGKSLDASSCFVLGRNIYQAACGNSQKASEYMASLNRKLSIFPNEIANHILAGMAYEIYFDSNSQYRESAKFDYASSVLGLLIKDDFKQAKSFIRHHLQDHIGKLLFIPGDQGEPKKEITITVTMDKDSEDGFVLDSVLFQDKELITDYDDASSWFTPSYNVSRIRTEVSSKLAIPEWALTWKTNHNVGDRRLQLPEGKMLSPQHALN